MSFPRLATTALLLSLLPGPAHASWNEEWTARKRFQIDTSASGANLTEPIGPGAVVLIRLTVGNFRFEAAKEDGSDLRFIAGDDKTPLKFHVEKYDALLGEALVWVSVPDLKPGAKTDVWLYSKNPKAVAAEDAKGTYDSATSLVFHFAERGQPPRDATSWSVQAANPGTTTDGAQIGRGLRFDGTSTVTIPAAPSLKWAAGAKLTWSAWIKPQDGAATGVLFARREGTSAFLVGLDAGKPFVEVSAGGSPQRVGASAGMGADKWHHVAVTAGEKLTVWVDGVAAGSAAASVPALAGPATLGGDVSPAEKSSAALPGFKGELDELQLHSIERPAGFIRFAAVSQGSDPGKLVVAGQDEESGGWSTGYFGVILKSVTLDGWVVIGLLAVMAVVSFWTMTSKASYLSTLERANRTFATRFQGESADLRSLIDRESGPASGIAQAAKDSSLARLFLTAAQEVRRRTSVGRAVTGEAVESIRASLDATLVREGQRLSRRMVLLTIAISGGPFLGLLGTVVGVMITFAAIAAAGDVNVNAIAPGIAAALVATVAGLAVAIPALFGYNWLLTRIKDVNATMQVFVDELVTKIAESYAGQEAEAPAPAPRAPVVATAPTPVSAPWMSAP